MIEKSFFAIALRNLFMALVVSLIAVSGCGLISSPSSPTSQNIQSISFISWGSPYFAQTTTTVTITKDTIAYIKDTTIMIAVRDSNDNVIYYEGWPDSLVLSWSKPIITSDFDSIASFIIINHIIGMPNPKPGLIGCGGYSLIIQLRNQTDTLGVYGCNLPQTEQLSELNEVSSGLTALVGKYSNL
jgi:hypothetical protein